MTHENDFHEQEKADGRRSVDLIHLREEHNPISSPVVYGIEIIVHKIIYR
jgi:hypothetical protein